MKFTKNLVIFLEGKTPGRILFCKKVVVILIATLLILSVISSIEIGSAEEKNDEKGTVINNEHENKTTSSVSDLKSIVINPDEENSKDTYISNDTIERNENFGNSNYIVCGIDDLSEYRALLEFDIPSKIGRLKSATLSLVPEFHESDIDLEVHAVQNQWYEGTGNTNGEENMTANWTHSAPGQPWYTVGGDYEQKPYAYKSCPIDDIRHSWNVTEIVNKWVEGTWVNNGFLMKPEYYYYGPIDNCPKFYSSSAGPELRPRLTLTYSVEIDPAVPDQTMNEDDPPMNISLEGREHETLTHVSSTSVFSHVKAPFLGSVDECRYQVIYTPEQVGNSGLIEKISFDRKENDMDVGNFSNLEIYMAYTKREGLTDTFDDNYFGNLSKVFSRNEIELNSSNDDPWIYFDFDEGFYYDSSFNLVIEIRWDGNGGNDVFITEEEYDKVNRDLMSWDLDSPTGTLDTNGYMPIVKFQVKLVDNITHISGPEDDTNYWPLYGDIGTHEGHYQSLYTPEEVGTEGSISRISIKKENPGDSGTFKDFHIFLFNVDIKNLSEGIYDNQEGLDTLVFERKSFTIESSDDPWIHFDLDTDFLYDSSYNLLLDIFWKNGTATIPTYVTEGFSENRRAWGNEINPEITYTDNKQTVAEFETEFEHNIAVDEGYQSRWVPFCSDDLEEMHIQMMYGDELLDESGVMDKLYLQSSEYETSSITVENLSIRLGHSHKDSLSNEFNSNIDDSWIEVLNASSYNISSNWECPWIEFDIDDTFDYNGQDNLVVDIRWKGRKDVVNFGVEITSALTDENYTAYSKDYSTPQAEYLYHDRYNFKAEFIEPHHYSWSASSTNTSLLTASTTGDTISEWELQINPQPNAHGTGYIELILSNTQGINVSQGVEVTINSVPDVPNVPTNPSPSNQSTGVSTSTTLTAEVSDPDGDPMDVSFYDASDDILIGTDSDVPSGGTASVKLSDLSKSSTFTWYVIADDGSHQTSSKIWSFNTIDSSNTPPSAPSGPKPNDGETGLSTSVDLAVSVSDPDGDPIDVSFYDASDDSFIGEVNGVSNGTTSTVTWDGLSVETIYQWYAVANDTQSETQSSVWTFTTASPSNVPPDKPINPYPLNGSDGVSLTTYLMIYVSDPDGDDLDVTFYNASDDNLLGFENEVSSGSTVSIIWSELSKNKTYEWYVIADDGEAETRSSIQHFSTDDSNNDPPTAPSKPSPKDNKTGVSTNPTLSVEVFDPDTDVLHVTFYDALDDSVIGTNPYVDNFDRASVTWSNLSLNKEYHWYAVVDDFENKTRSPTWSFNTGDTPNTPPDPPSNPSPSNWASDIDTETNLSVEVTDPDGDMMNITFYDASDDSLIGSDNSLSSGDTASVSWSSLSEGTTYEWYTVVSDGISEVQSSTWEFTTGETQNQAPDMPRDPSPNNGNIEVTTEPVLSVLISDPDEDMLNVTFYDASDDSVIGSVEDVMSGDTASITWSGLNEGTSYRWYVVISDGQEERTSSTYSFATEEKTSDSADDKGGSGNTMLYLGIGIIAVVAPLAVMLIFKEKKKGTGKDSFEEQVEKDMQLSDEESDGDIDLEEDEF